MAYFVPYQKMNDATYVAKLYFQEIIRLHKIPKIITSNRYLKFISHFLELYGKRWAFTFSSILQVIPTLMVKLKLQTKSWEIYYQALLEKTFENGILYLYK